MPNIKVIALDPFNTNKKEWDHQGEKIFNPIPLKIRWAALRKSNTRINHVLKLVMTRFPSLSKN